MKKYTFQTWKSGNWFYAIVARLIPHHYSKHTSYGERTKLKPGRWQDVPGRHFPTRKEAQDAAKQYIKTLIAQ